MKNMKIVINLGLMVGILVIARLFLAILDGLLFAPPPSHPDEILSLSVEGHIKEVAFIERGNALLIFAGSLYRWSLPNGPLTLLLGPVKQKQSYSFPTTPFPDGALSPDEKLLARDTWEHNIEIISLEDRRVRQVLVGHEDFVDSLAWNSDSTLLVSGSRDHTVRLWRVKDGELLRVWRYESEPYITEVAFSADGSLVASGALLNRHPHKGTLEIRQVSTGGLLYDLPIEGYVSVLAFSPDGSMMAGSIGSDISIWHVDDGTLIHSFKAHEEPVTALAFSPDNTLLASGAGGGMSGVDGDTVDRTVRLWRVADTQLLETFEGHSLPVEDVAFSPDGCQLLSGSPGTVKLWRICP